MDDSNKSKDELIEEIIALRESEQNCTHYLDSMGDALTVLDLNRNMLKVNLAAVRLWGCESKEEISNLRIEQRYPERVLSKIFHEMDIAERTGTVRPFESVVLTRQGKEIPVMISGTAMKNSEGELQGYVGVFRDITRLKQLENTVRHLTEMEREKLRCDLHDSTSQLLAAAQYLAASLIRSLSATHPEAAAHAEELARIVEDAQKSIRSVAEGLQPLPGEPQALATALGELAHRTNETRGIPCQFTLHEPVLIEDLDAAGQLYLIAQEAVANATQHARASKIEVSLSERDGVVRLVVRDDGVGISAGKWNERMGVGIMRSRSAKIGAYFDVEQGEAGGTIVTCTWNKTSPPT